MRRKRVAPVFLAVLLATASACRAPTAPDPLVGTWLATSFKVAPAGQAQQDVLASGGTLGVNVAAVESTFVTAGTVILPATVTGSTTFTASLAGTAVRTASAIQLATDADSFVRDLVFTLVENRLEAVNQVVAGTTYNVILTKQ
jgi:hypothetical protein